MATTAIKRLPDTKERRGSLRLKDRQSNRRFWGTMLLRRVIMLFDYALVSRDASPSVLQLMRKIRTQKMVGHYSTIP